jgi:tRNA(Arg) A34 adenosine deaminase TadA
LDWNDEKLMMRAIELARTGMLSGRGGPFGAVVAKEGVVIAEGCNEVTSTNDPTAHAEIVAIRNACRELGGFQLEGCRIYTSCEPCPMCLGAIYWARPERFFFAGTREDAAEAGFDDEMIYEEISAPLDARRLKAENLLRDSARALFREWIEFPDKVTY